MRIFCYKKLLQKKSFWVKTMRFTLIRKGKEQGNVRKSDYKSLSLDNLTSNYKIIILVIKNRLMRINIVKMITYLTILLKVIW